MNEQYLMFGQKLYALSSCRWTPLKRKICLLFVAVEQTLDIQKQSKGVFSAS